MEKMIDINQDNTKETAIPYKHLVITMIILKYLFVNYLNWRQYKRITENKPFPRELKDLNIDEENYHKSRVYSKDKMKFGFVKDTVETLIGLVMIQMNYWAMIWNYGTLYLGDSNEYYLVFFFLLLEIFRGNILDIPFDYYHIFVLEEKYNFNKNTLYTFAKDNIISMILKITLLPIVISILVFTINKGGEYFYIYAEIVSILLVFVMMWLYPNVIAPLFNKFSELEDEKLKTSLYKLSERVNYPLKKIYCVDASRRTAHSNAYLYGFGNNKRIVLFDTLLKKLTHEQIEAVLGHELGHWKMSHTVKNLLNVFLQMFIMFYLFGYFLNNQGVYYNFGFEQVTSCFIGLALFSLIYSPVSFVLEILTLKLTRVFEFQADEFAHSLGLSNDLKTGLMKLFEENLGDMDPDPLYSQFNHSHPTLLERLRAMDALDSKHN